MKNVFNSKLYFSLIIVAISIIIYIILNSLINRLISKRSLSDKKLTYAKLLKNLSKYVLLIVDLLYILHIYGINVTSIAAGLGIITIVITLSLQDALKDIIMGFNLIIDDYFNVGDVVKIDNITGKVLEIGFKTTKIKDIYTNNIYIVANRNLSSATIVSDWLDIDIPIPYECKVVDVEKVIEEINNRIKDIKKVKDVEYKGLNEFGDSAIYYKIRVFVDAENKPQVGRDARRIIKLELDRNNIDIPYQQIDIHRK